MALYKCTVCNYIEEADELTGRCIKCNAPVEKFTELSEDAVEKIYASDRTNDINMEIITLCAKIVDLCDEGIELNLDPACVKGFTLANDSAWQIKQVLKAEIENHIGKGKW